MEWLDFSEMRRRWALGAALVGMIAASGAPLTGKPSAAGAQEQSAGDAASAEAAGSAPSSARAEGIRPPVRTAGNARTFNFTVPAPRGQILDRRGQPLANSRVVHQLGIVLPKAAGVPDSEVLAQSARAVTAANGLLGTRWALEDGDVLEHYRHRRWFPMRLSPIPLTDEQVEKLRQAGLIGDGSSPGALALEPVYMRHYPGGPAACHIVGYVGRKTPLETGEIRDEEILFENLEGRAGLEIAFDTDLTGRDGLVNFTFDESGTLVEQSVLRPPEPGHNVVTTLDVSLQHLAETVLARHAKRGALVVVDADTGDILTLASYPVFDPNAFVPFISQAAFDALNNDPDAPLFGRAHSAAYPPGSTFKPFVASALLERGSLTPQTMYDGVPSVEIDGRPFRNWNDEPEGMIDVTGALARSCNTFFYQAAIDNGPDAILQVARLVGFGQPTGIPVAGEAAGSLPGGPLSRQATANLSIGQGEVLVTPLQLAVAIGSVANGRQFLGPRLVVQVQDYANNVLKHDRGGSRGYIHCSPATLQAVRLGMDQVVNGPRGTATRARRDHPRIAGKTGTAQWSAGDGRQRHLGWFTGFTYSSNPQLAFVAVYEGDPGESVGGSTKAAPIIADFLGELYKDPGAFGFDQPVDSAPPDPSISPWVTNGSGSYPKGSVPYGAYAAHGGAPTYDPNRQTIPGSPVRAARPPAPFWKRWFGN